MRRDTPYLDLEQLDEDQPYFDASAVPQSSGSSCEEHTYNSEGRFSNASTENLCRNNKDFKVEITSF